MISYRPFWDTLKNKNLNQYRLKQEIKISNAILDKLRHNKPLNLTTIDDICLYLGCRIEDVVEIIEPDKAD